MTWTYTAVPTSSDKDAVRLLIGDTKGKDNPALQLLQDEEIDFLLAETPNPLRAAAAGLEAIAANFAPDGDARVGDLSESGGAVVEKLAARAKELRKRANRTAQVFAGGISIAGKVELDRQADAVQPSFRIGQDDFPGTEPRDIFDIHELLGF